MALIDCFMMKLNIYMTLYYLLLSPLHSMALSGKTLRRHVHVQQFEIAKHA